MWQVVHMVGAGLTHMKRGGETNSCGGERGRRGWLLGVVFAGPRLAREWHETRASLDRVLRWWWWHADVD